MRQYIEKLEDIIDSVGGIGGFILCMLIAGIVAFALMTLAASVIMLYFKITT